MSDLNMITITGRLTRNAATKTVGNGKCLLTFGVANNIGFGEYEKTNFYTVNMWGERGLKLVQYLTQGTKVGVSGEESLNVWTGKDGVEHMDRVITTMNITLLGSPSAKSNAETGAAFSSSDDRFGGDEAPVF